MANSRQSHTSPAELTGFFASAAENHDTGSTLNHWPFPWNHLHEGYAYILTHPGSPCVFYDHFWDDSLSKTIRDCIALRRRHKIGCRGKVHDCRCSSHSLCSACRPLIAFAVSTT